jgi:nucleotide-binding universal stress UspA family protein
VVGVDDSAEAAHAYRWAVLRGDRFGPVTPVAAWQYPWWYYIGAPMIAPDGPGPDIERDAAKMVDQLVAGAPPGPQTDPIVARGRAGRILVEVAENAALLVVGTRGRGALADQVLGSVSNYCAAHSPVPLVVVPENRPVDDSSGLILVGIDGSEGADAALDWALRYASAEDRVVAYQAWDIPVITGYESIAIDPTVVEGATVEAAARTAAAACERVGVPTGRVEVRVGEGDPRGVLQRLGADADLIVVGRRGHGRVAHAVLGSVTTALVHRPVAPIAVVPPRAD